MALCGRCGTEHAGGCPLGSQVGEALKPADAATPGAAADLDAAPPPEAPPSIFRQWPWIVLAGLTLAGGAIAFQQARARSEPAPPPPATSHLRDDDRGPPERAANPAAAPAPTPAAAATPPAAPRTTAPR